jgi:hypothetical protein
MDALIEVLIAVVFWNAGRLLVFVLTIGYVRGERWGEEKSIQYPWFALARDDKDQWVLSSRACAWLGGIATLSGIVAYLVLTK